MDKNSLGSNKNKSCCEKLFLAFRNPSPFLRTIRFTSPIAQSDRCVQVPRVNSVAVVTPPNVSLTTTNHKDRCPRIAKQSVAPAAADSRTEAEKKVAVIQDHRGNHSKFSSPTINQAKPKATILPIHGNENTIPAIPHVGGGSSNIAESINGLSSEYINRIGEKIRSPSNVGVILPSIARDSFNDRIDEFISRTKDKFHTASSFIDKSEGKGRDSSSF